MAASPHRKTFVAALVLCLAAVGPAQAWAPLGHRIVGELAQRQLTPSARAEALRLMAREPEPSLAGIANWADDLRTRDPARFKLTSRWHYVNFGSPDCHYDAARDCKDGNCVVAAIERQLAILADRAQPDAARLEALRFVVHFVGDAHQPMHAGNRGDSGGNKFQVSLRTALPPEDYAKKNYVDGMMGTNLHSVWDYYVLGETRLSTRAYADKLMPMPRLPANQSPAAPPGTPMATPARWAEESCALPDAWGIYPESHVLAGDYGDAMRPLAERRLRQAGWRLAMLLNQALSRQAP